MGHRKPRPRQSHIFVKEANGHYVEPRWCSDRLLDVERFGHKGNVIWDPACGWGTILLAAKNHGFKALGSDVVEREHCFDFRFSQHDFLNGGFPDRAMRRTTSVICNPPFDHVEEFCIRALQFAQYKVAMLCLLRRLPAAHWLGELPLETIYALTPRPSMPPGHWIAAGNKPGGGTQDFVWLVFNKRLGGRVPRPQWKWLKRDVQA
jgi:hypothetical protein